MFSWNSQYNRVCYIYVDFHVPKYEMEYSQEK